MCAQCCCKTLLFFSVIALIALGLLIATHPAFNDDEDVIHFIEDGDVSIQENGIGRTASSANQMVDRIISVMKKSAMISPQLNNITIERKLDLKHGTLEGLNIQGLIAGMHRSGDAVLAASGARFFLAMPITITNVTVRGVHQRESPVGAIQASGVAHVDMLESRFKVSLGAIGMNLDDFKITRIGRIRMRELDFLPGLDWLFSWISETTINQRRTELVVPLEEAGRRVFQKALRNAVTQEKIAEFIAEKTNRLRMLG